MPSSYPFVIYLIEYTIYKIETVIYDYMSLESR